MITVLKAKLKEGLKATKLLILGHDITEFVLSKILDLIEI